MNLTDGQLAALKMVESLGKWGGTCRVGILGGFAGTGKALASDQLVQTPRGPVCISDLHVGDQVCGVDADIVTVEGVFPQGVRQAYRVTFRDGTSVECDIEHLWNVQTPKMRTKGRFCTLTLQEILNKGLRFDSGSYRFQIPLCQPAHADPASLPIDPYLLGALIGDGTSLGKTPTLSVPEDKLEVLHFVVTALPIGMETRVNTAPACPQYRFIDPTQSGNRLGQSFRDLGLNLKSPQRFIPPNYLYRASSPQRLALLQGLMDTDGSCCKNRTKFSTTSKQLARDIVILVQSLGGTAIITKQARGDLDVNVKMFQCPFRAQPKANRWAPSKKNPPSRYIVAVEPTRLCEHTCIKVSGEEGLFLTNSYIVTHNTTTIKHVAEQLGGCPVVVAPTGKAACRVREATGLTARTIHSWMYCAHEDEETGEVTYSQRDQEEIQTGEVPLLVVDEGSMVAEDIWRDIYRTARECRMNILVVGDPFQLPPVQKSEGPVFNLMGPTFQADLRVQLTEVTRQALDSPIIRAAKLVREGDVAEAMGVLDGVRPSSFIQAAAEVAAGGGAVVVHRNETRHRLNTEIRKALGLRVGEINPGEPLLVLKNNYRLSNFNGESLKFLGWAQGPTEMKEVWCWIRKVREHTRFGVADLLDTGSGEPVTKQAILAEMEVFGGLQKVSSIAVTAVARANYRRGISEEGEQRAGHSLLSANFGYALTAHKCQGSQWDEVLVCLESSVRLHELDGRRWVYTAISRGAKRVRICLGLPRELR